MSKIVVLGGGVIGLSMALMLAKEGLDVTVLERDSGPVPQSPQEAWQAWDRRGVAQFRQPHYLAPGGRGVLDDVLPEVTSALAGAHGAVYNALSGMPPSVSDRAPREGDERFVTVTGRRPMLEYAVASVAGQVADIRRGVQVAGLVTGLPAVKGIPNVTGVRLADGEEIQADLVIDATGRRSALPGWLTEIGAQDPAEEAADSGFTYYTRYFRSPAGVIPPFRTGLLMPFDCYSLLTIPCDAGTWSVTVYVSSRDRALKELRHPELWTALVAACPLHAHLLEGEPISDAYAISDVYAMSGIADRWRRFAVDGTPVATGVVAVGDAWASTNPSLGRGITIGLMHAAGTAEVVRGHLGDPLALAAAHDQMTQERVTPWYRATVEFDRARMEQITASIEGRPAPAPDGPEGRVSAAMLVAMMHDPDIFRAFMEIMTVVTLPQQVLARPGLADRIMEIADGHEAMMPPGPSRREVLRMVA